MYAFVIKENVPNIVIGPKNINKTLYIIGGVKFSP